MAQKYARRGGKKFVTLTITFKDLDDLQKFVIDTMEPALFVYQGDAKDIEFAGNAPAGSYVLRHKGTKPETMRA